MVSNIFYFHPEPWENDPIWRAYFSNGLEPPSSLLFRLYRDEILPRYGGIISKIIIFLNLFEKIPLIQHIAWTKKAWGQVGISWVHTVHGSEIRRTSWYIVVYAIIYGVFYIPGSMISEPSTVCLPILLSRKNPFPPSPGRNEEGQARVDGSGEDCVSVWSEGQAGWCGWQSVKVKLRSWVNHLRFARGFKTDIFFLEEVKKLKMWNMMKHDHVWSEWDLGGGVKHGFGLN